jgi:hypothetical protein
MLESFKWSHSIRFPNYEFLFSAICGTCYIHLLLLPMITLIVFVGQNTLWSSPLCSFLQHCHYHNYKNITAIIHTHLSKNTVSFFVFCIGRALTFAVLTFCFFWVGTLVRLFTHLIVPGNYANNTHFTYYFVTIYSYLITERLNHSMWQCFINYIIWYILPLE